MKEYQITCKVHDSQDRVIYVGIGDSKYSIEKIWNWIVEKVYGFYTMAGNNKATVHPGTSKNGRKFLTTSPDGITENNLDELPRCV